ncbi:hypothetical protein FOA52_009079 [Chlamydomonas sp. UWO 241]|nr:hypothetical protein FOA52_009079 [Chlamydomonas sp. UWO 241]
MVHAGVGHFDSTGSPFLAPGGARLPSGVQHFGAPQTAQPLADVTTSPGGGPLADLLDGLRQRGQQGRAERLIDALTPPGESPPGFGESASDGGLDALNAALGSALDAGRALGDTIDATGGIDGAAAAASARPPLVNATSWAYLGPAGGADGAGLPAAMADNAAAAATTVVGAGGGGGGADAWGDPVVDAVVGAVPGGAAAQPEYREYLMEGVRDTLQWVQDLLLPPGLKAPPVYEPGVESGDQAVQLSTASERLRDLGEQLRDARMMYRVENPEDNAALSSVMHQMGGIADRLSRVSGQLADQNGYTVAAADATGCSVGGGGGFDNAILGTLEGLYEAVVVDSGLRELLSATKRMGDDLAIMMDATWSGVPPAARLAAYAASIAGALFLMRSRLPTALAAHGANGRIVRSGGTVPAVGLAGRHHFKFATVARDS